MSGNFLYMGLLLAFMSCWAESAASGLDLDNPELGPDNVLYLGVSWQHSWRYEDSTGPSNHDGVWLFCKGRRVSDNEWEHLIISPFGTAADAPLEANVSHAGTGLMVRRSGAGEGPLNSVGVRIALEQQGLGAYSELRVFGIEMVYVPGGSFYAGDGASNNTLTEALSGLPFLVSSASAIHVGEGEGELWSQGTAPLEGDIPESYPKGYRGLYCMKYEISQDQYCGFLNTLDVAGRSLHRPDKRIEAPCFSGDHLEGERNFIVEDSGIFGCDANGNGILGEADDGSATACNFLTWSSLAAYLDWSGLRPMSELEFEKICRGPLSPVAYEFAWGTPHIVNTTDIQAIHTSEEHCNDSLPGGAGLANYGYCQPAGPLRCGFASFGSGKRYASGASYYGVMEMSGNVWELCISLGESGLGFSGLHGDGFLAVSGHSDVPGWAGGGHRGGGWNSGIVPGFRDLAVSDRFFINLDPDEQARGTAGGRGVLSQSELE